MIANAWITVSDVFIAWYKEHKDDEGYEALSKVHDYAVVERLFNTLDYQGKVFKLFSIYTESTAEAKVLFDKLAEVWPDDFIILGAWWFDGRQVGTQWVLDEDEQPTDVVTGTPSYPIHPQAYRFMHDVVVADFDGTEISRTPATSNADLKDVNVLVGQSFRHFT